MSTKVLMPASSAPKTRLRKTHRKSRYGCANCKLRRVKCDELKPRCLKCVSFSIECSYEPGSEMELGFTGSFRVDLGPSKPTPLSLPLPRRLPDLPTYLPLAGAQGNQLYELGSLDRDLLKKFLANSILTVGPKGASMIFQASALDFAMTTPFLTHLVLAVTLLYDIHANRSNKLKEKKAVLAFHFYHGVSLFNAKLSKAVEPSEKDALWCAAALTGQAAFADVKAEIPAEAWPLMSRSPADLDWLKMTGGKKAVYDLTNPTRPRSIFNASCNGFIEPSPVVSDEILSLPPKFIELYNLNERSTPENNPYHGAATVLAKVMPLECNRTTITKFLSFVGFPDTRFLRLLEQRDSRAMLLLAYWYAKTLTSEQWWIWRRATIEGPALCIFLEGVFGDNPELLELLDFPKAIFAAAAVNGCSNSPF